MSNPSPRLQRFWDWRAAGNFIGGGTGSGLFLAAAVAAVFGMPPLLPVLLALVLVAGGLGLVWTELGQPWRFLNVFRHPARSWMTREALAAGPLIVVGVVGAWLANAALLAIGVVFALLFLACQARILNGAKGIPAWSVAASVPLLLVTGLAEGAGAFVSIASVTALWPSPVAIHAAAWLLLPLIVARWAMWWAYRESVGRIAPAETVDLLRRVDGWFVGLGHALPAALVLAAPWLAGWSAAALAIAGLGIMLTGWQVKYLIVTRAAHTRICAPARDARRGGGAAVPQMWTAIR